MRIDFSLFFVFVLFVFIYCALKKLRYRNFSNFFLSYLISAIILLIICPPTADEMNDLNSSTLIYFTIIFFLLLLLIIYAGIMALNDRE